MRGPTKFLTKPRPHTFSFLTVAHISSMPNVSRDMRQARGCFRRSSDCACNLNLEGKLEDSGMSGSTTRSTTTTSGTSAPTKPSQEKNRSNNKLSHTHTHALCGDCDLQVQLQEQHPVAAELGAGRRPHLIDNFPEFSFFSMRCRQGLSEYNYPFGDWNATEGPWPSYEWYGFRMTPEDRGIFAESQSSQPVRGSRSEIPGPLGAIHLSSERVQPGSAGWVCQLSWTQESERASRQSFCQTGTNCSEIPVAPCAQLASDEMLLGPGKVRILCLACWFCAKLGQLSGECCAKDPQRRSQKQRVRLGKKVLCSRSYRRTLCVPVWKPTRCDIFLRTTLLVAGK